MAIYDLPKMIDVNGEKRLIRADFRPCLDIILAFEDKNLTETEKISVMLEILFVKPKFAPDDLQNAVTAAVRFLNGGATTIAETSSTDRLYSWTKDANFIFSGIDRVLGYSCRSCAFLHWWEFLAAFNDMGECGFSRILHMRIGAKRGTLTKSERREFSENREIYSLKSMEEIEKEREFIKKLNF
jgi:hypothetical protein